MFWIYLASAISLASSPEPSRGGIRIEVEATGLKNGQGRLFCHLYAQAKGYPDDPQVSTYRTHGAIQGKKGKCVFTNIKPGRYAVSLLHDEDSDDRMKTNFIGIPQEGWGASRDAPAQTFGPPRFEDAVMEFKENTSIRVRTNY